jgi:iron complex transport system substrate-binding protein
VLTRRRFVGMALAAAAVPGRAWAQRRVIVDGAGRRVEVPGQARRVFAAGGPASIFVYTLAPDTLLGWTRALTPEERPWLPPRYAELPALGRLTGRGNTANVEVVLATRPDVVLDFGTIGGTYASLADRVQEQTKVPYLLLDGGLAATARAYTLAGDLLAAPEPADKLALYVERTLEDVDRCVASRRWARSARPRRRPGCGPRRVAR